MAVDAFLKIEGIPGDSTDPKHKGEIEVLAFSWNIKLPIAQGGGGGGAAGKAQVSDFSVIKRVDSASPALFGAVCTGQHFPEALFTAEGVATGKGSTSFYKVTFSEVFISGVAPTGGGGDLPTEQLSLNFSKVEIEYKSEKGEGKVTSCDFVKGE